ncbi:MAG TPA: hypothetical protein VFY60_13755 [Pyrinomonadaceae bacterium]|nr:hypothetical protein [Pyrinomonadaceae bacterium]
MTQTYRRKRNGTAWHFCSNCRHWPTADYESRKDKPESSELCEQCKAKRFNGNCKS